MVLYVIDINIYSTGEILNIIMLKMNCIGGILYDKA